MSDVVSKDIVSRGSYVKDRVQIESYRIAYGENWV